MIRTAPQQGTKQVYVAGRQSSQGPRPAEPCDPGNFFHWPQNESEFRDKLSPIHIALNFSLDPQAPVDSHGLQPVLHYQSKSRIEDKVRPVGRGQGSGLRGCPRPSNRWGGPSGSEKCPIHPGHPHQVQILLDCGEDNVCVPDLQLEVFG